MAVGMTLNCPRLPSVSFGNRPVSIRLGLSSVLSDERVIFNRGLGVDGGVWFGARHFAGVLGSPRALSGSR